MKTATLFRRCALVLFLLSVSLFHASESQAQGRMSTYIVQTNSNSFSSIQGSGINVGLTNCQGCYTTVPNTTGLPFLFNYDNQVFAANTPLYIYQNGEISWSSSYSGNPYNWLDPESGQGPSAFPNTINVASGYQYVTQGVYYQIDGISPTRVATFEWDGAGDYWNWDFGCCSYPITNYQVKMYEGSWQIDFNYAAYYLQLNYNNTYYHIGIGLNGTTAGGFQQIAVYGGSNNSWTTPGSNFRFIAFQPNRQLGTNPNPKILNFGVQVVGTTSTQTITARHAGTQDVVTLQAPTFQGSPDFTIISGPPAGTVLSVGQSAVPYVVQFKPSQGGIRTTLVSINSNGRDSGIQSYILTGSGILSDYVYDSTILFRKTRTKLGDTLIQWVHITATGGAPVVFTNIKITGSDAGQYQLIPGHPTGNTVPAPPSPLSYDSVGVMYIPTIEGKHVANLVLTSNALTFPTATISLQGTGILPHIVITPPKALLFDSTAEGDTVCKNITIWNPGTDTLRLSANFLSSNDGDFIYTGLKGADTAIAPDVTKTVTVCFHPLQQGTRVGRLEIHTNIIRTFETPRRDTGSIYFIDLRGNGLPLGVLANSLGGTGFTDSAVVGKTVCEMDTLKNIGDADILITKLHIGGNNGGDFAQSGLPAVPFTLKARSSMVYTLCGTPSAPGLRSGIDTVVGTSGGRKLTLLLDLKVFGFNACDAANPSALFIDTSAHPNVTTKVIMGTRDTMCTTITNCGQVTDVYTAKLSASAIAAGYSIVSTPTNPNPSGPIAPAGTYNFCVEFNSTAVGATTEVLTVSSPNEVDLTIPLTAEGTCSSVAFTGGSAADAGTTGDNDRHPFQFTLTNTGGAPWTPCTETITSTAAAGTWTLDSISPAIVPANGQSTVFMTFHPALGTQNTTITGNISWPCGGPCQTGPVGVDLTGKVIQSSVARTESNGFSLEQSYPNPTQGNATFSFTTPTETEVRITLVDMTGRLIQTLITGRVSEGEHIVKLNASNLASGTYMYILESGSTKLVRQIILTK